MGLKVLLKIDDQLQFRKVEITSEDERTYSIKSKGICLPYIRKDHLYKSVSGNIFGFDKTKMINAWNEDIETKIKINKAELELLEKSIIPDSFEGEIYKIQK